MALSALASVRRGLRNVRANWPLLVVQGATSAVVTALIVIGLLPLPLALGLAAGEELPASAEELPEWLATVGRGLSEDLPALTGSLLAALTATVLIWLLAFMVVCFCQAGTYGVLFAADRQARPGARDWRFFRTFSLRDFGGWGARDLWRFFWFLNLAGAVLLAIVAAFGLLLAGAAVGAETWGPQAAVGIGCGGMLPLVFVVIAVAFWSALGQALLPTDLSVWQAAKLGLRMAGQRFGAVFALFALTAIATFASVLLLAPLAFAKNVLAADRPALQLGLQVPFSLIQGLIGAMVGVTLAASVVALVRGEAEERAG